VVVAGPGHPLDGHDRLRTVALTGHRWLAGPAGHEAGTEEARWFDGTPEPEIERLDSEADALAAVRAGAGLMLALGHAVRDDVRRGSLVRLPVEGTPVTGLWWASVPGEGAGTSAARALQRFLTTPDATTALLARPARPDRARPTVRVELWS
jgi:DNA-binding transcriptional LysR family regulator